MIKKENIKDAEKELILILENIKDNNIDLPHINLYKLLSNHELPKKYKKFQYYFNSTLDGIYDDIGRTYSIDENIYNELKLKYYDENYIENDDGDGDGKPDNIIIHIMLKSFLLDWYSDEEFDNKNYFKLLKDLTSSNIENVFINEYYKEYSRNDNEWRPVVSECY